MDFCKRFQFESMKRKIFICNTYHSVRKFLKKRFGNDHCILERHAALINPIDDPALIWKYIQEDNFEELIFTQDLDCIFFRDIILQKNELEFPQMTHLMNLYLENFGEIDKEAKVSSKIGALYLAYLEEIVGALCKNPFLNERINMGQLEIKGMFTQLQKEKSIEFKLNIANQPL